MTMRAAGSEQASAADAPLRRDVRLLGDELGRVLVEQEGPELLEAVETIRRLSRETREHADTTRRATLASVTTTTNSRKSRLRPYTPDSVTL